MNTIHSIELIYSNPKIPRRPSLHRRHWPAGAGCGDVHALRRPQSRPNRLGL